MAFLWLINYTWGWSDHYWTIHWEPILQVGSKTLTFLVAFLGMLIWPETQIKWLPKGSTGHELNHLVCYIVKYIMHIYIYMLHIYIYIFIYRILYKLGVYMYIYTYHIYPSWTFLLVWFTQKQPWSLTAGGSLGDRSDCTAAVLLGV